MKNDFYKNISCTYSNLPKSLYREVHAQNFENAKLLLLNRMLIDSLNLNCEFFESNEGLVGLLGVSEKSIQSIAMAYAGHQYGHFTTLGDGRALLIGEYQHNDKRFDIHLKGSGQTPYSRNGDGRATLKSCLREYLMSEAMHALGIPTTRSLAVIDTGDKIRRNFYENAGILVRIASSHIRVGTFEYAKRENIKVVKSLADYAITRHDPKLKLKDNKYEAFYDQVIKRQAYLMGKWQSVGFIHGVMNTDNMVISGETIDYGPCAFMNEYNPKTVYSSIDRFGRYAYGNQPLIAHWNLARLGEVLSPLLKTNEQSGVEVANRNLENFTNYYDQYWLDLMTNKIGIKNHKQSDKALISELLNLMDKHQLDFTNTFRSLKYNLQNHSNKDLTPWVLKWRKRLDESKASQSFIVKTMNEANPSIIPRNYLVEKALNKADTGDIESFTEYLEILKKPYSRDFENSDYSKPPKSHERVQQTYCGT